MSGYKISLVLCLLLIQSHGLFGSNKVTVSGDTTKQNIYYTDLSDKFILRFYTLYKSNTLNVSLEDQQATYKPNGRISLGVGFNYKFIGLGISFGMPISQSSINKYGNTQRIDIQFSLYSRRVGLDGFFQVYRGYYLANPDDFVNWDQENYPQLSDMRIMTLGFNAFYILNHDKFSYKAAYVRNQVQDISAGTITVGLFGNYDAVVTDNGFIPQSIEDTSLNNFDLKAFSAATVGVSVGYMYNFVINKWFFINLAAAPGLGYRHYRLQDLSNQYYHENKAAIHILARGAIGYDKRKWFINFTAAFNFRYYNYKSYEINLSTEQLRLTFGIRL